MEGKLNNLYIELNKKFNNIDNELINSQIYKIKELTKRLKIFQDDENNTKQRFRCYDLKPSNFDSCFNLKTIIFGDKTPRNLDKYVNLNYKLRSAVLVLLAGKLLYSEK